MAEQQGLIQQFRNTFEGGLDTDTVSSFLKSNTYRDAQNLSMVTNGKFFSLMNIAGTTSFGTLPGVSSTARIIGVYKNFYQILGVGSNIPCLTIFGYDNTYFKIWCFNTVANTFYELYQEPKNSLMVQNSDKVIDAVSYAEYGYDDLYFTDNVNEPRKIQCIIPSPYVANFMTATQIALPQRKSIGQLAGVPTSGGSLLTGTYQLCLQLVVPSTNKYTRFGLLTNPIHIYTSDTIAKAGVGLPSSSKIVASATFTADEYANYTHFRIGVVSNIYPEGTVNTVVGLTKLEKISDYFTGGTSIGNYNILSNAQINTTTIDEVVVDLAALDYVKTVNIKRNRLLLGNINLKNMSYNGGTPAIGSGTIIQYSNSNTAIKDTFSIMADSSTKRGHFRDEVYRYAISYFDKWGNFSSPKTLDLSSVQDNQISGGSKDMRFPPRSYTSGGRYYTVLNGNDQTVSLGLRLNNLVNHPKWAAGFVILRAKRKKNILSQSPFIPMSKVFGLGALQNYPTIVIEPPTATVTHASATPMGPGLVVMPPNLYFGSLVQTSDINDKDYHYLVTSNAGSIVTYKNEPYNLSFQTSLTHAMIFPQDSMYSQLSPFVPTGNEQISIIDMMATKCYYNTFGGLPAGAQFGIYADDSISTSFFTVQNTNVYAASGFTPGVAVTGTYNIGGYKFIDNLGDGVSLNGIPILDSSKLTTPSVVIGYKFNNQRCAVIAPQNATGSAISLLNAPNVPITFPGLSATTTFSSNTLSNFVKPQFGYSSSQVVTTDPYGNNRALTAAIQIINITSTYQDNRYGAMDEQNEFILTGAQYNFTSAEQATLAAGGTVTVSSIDVWGGDCFVSYHTFKVSETAWSIMDYGKVEFSANNGVGTDAPDNIASAITKYGNIYIANSSDNAPLHIPFFFKNHAQYLTIPLESEYNGSVRDIDTPDVVTTQNTIPIYGAAVEYKARAPMGYNYNINLNKQNDQKIFIPLDSNIPVQLQYKARVMYSDEKIYSTLINGFDIFRVGNIYDYEERYGGLTKLALGGDNLYGLQEKAMFYIPINERVMETTDASQLAVRTGDFISQPLYITNNKGCQHIKSVVQQGQFVICADQINRQVFKIQNQEFEIISDKGMISKMQDNLTPTIYEDALVGLYDFLKDEYWLVNIGNSCYVYNDDFKIWTSNYQWPNNLFGGVYQNGQFWLVGYQSTGSFTTGVQLHTMYTDSPGKLLGTYVTPSLTFIINPTLEYSKTFDNLEINSTDRLATIDIQIDREASVGNQNMITESLLTVGTRGEGGYMFKSIRDASNARMRGLYANVTLKWQTNAVVPQVGISSVVSNSRLSSKIF